MKNSKLYFLSFIFILFVACSDDDDNDDTPNLAPTVPELVSPENAATDVSLDVTFSWKASTDNEATTITYTLHYALSEDMANAVKVNDDEPTDLKAVANLESSTTYYWQVTATDEDAKSSKSAVRSFTTIAVNSDVVTDSKLYISEYYKGSSNNKYLELYNASDASIDLSNYQIKLSHNGVGFDAEENYEYQLTGSLVAKTTYLLVNDGAGAAFKEKADVEVAYENSKALSFTGNDAVGLFVKQGDQWKLCDIIGEEKSAETIDELTKVLIRKEAVLVGDPNWATAKTNYLVKEADWVYSIGIRGVGVEPAPIANTTDSKLLISEYFEGSGYDKYIELYNAGTEPIDLSTYELHISTGSVFEKIGDMSGNLEANETYLIVNNHSQTSQILTSAADLSVALNFNGDKDAIGLFKKVANGLSLADVIGVVSTTNDDEIAGVQNALKDHTLVRKEEITVGQPDWQKSKLEWIVKDKDYTYSMGIRAEGQAPEYVFKDAEAVNQLVEDFQTLAPGRPSIAGWYTHVMNGSVYFEKTGSVYLGIDPLQEVTESWLVSPKLNFDAANSNKNVSFELKRGYMKNEVIQIFISQDFDPTSDQAIENASWTEITDKVSLPSFEDNGWSEFVSSGTIDLSDQTGIVRIAIKYSCDGTQDGGRLYFDNFKFNFNPNAPGTSSSNPMTIVEAIADYSGSKWVKGFIVGSVVSGPSLKTSDFSNTNIAIAPTADETDIANCLIVQLPSGDVRTALNLVDNAANLKKEIVVFGSLQDYYGGKGMKSTSEYLILTN